MADVIATLRETLEKANRYGGGGDAVLLSEAEVSLISALLDLLPCAEAAASEWDFTEQRVSPATIEALRAALAKAKGAEGG